MPQKKEEATWYLNKPNNFPFNQDFAEVYIEDVKIAEHKVTASQNIEIPNPLPDKNRELFLEMRQISKKAGFYNPYDKLPSLLFYSQAKFMENFEDDFEENAAYSMYFPNYQMMGYEQLRTYFTWRTKVRAGEVNETSFSYVFVYIYELINDIGVKDCQDGLDKLIYIWNEYRRHEKKLDDYMSEWIKDYYITNDFSFTFDELIQKHGLLQEIFDQTSSESYFDLYSPYSDYKINQSIFYTQETEKIIIECFNYVVKAIIQFMNDLNADFNELIFYKNKDNTWVPFRKSLYY